MQKTSKNSDFFLFFAYNSKTKRLSKKTTIYKIKVDKISYKNMVLDVFLSLMGRPVERSEYRPLFRSLWKMQKTPVLRSFYFAIEL